MPVGDQFEDSFVQGKFVAFQVWIEAEFFSEMQDFFKFRGFRGFRSRRRRIGDVVPEAFARDLAEAIGDDHFELRSPASVDSESCLDGNSLAGL